MKAFLAAMALVSVSTAAMAGGAVRGAGGEAPELVGKLVTVTVCDGGESGTECRRVTYRVRPASAPVAEKCTTIRGEATEEPCPTRYGVPRWLRKLNEAFYRAGARPLPEQPPYSGHGEI